DFFGLFSGTNPTFYYSSTKQSWTEAQSFCRQHYTDLASARHLADNEAVQGLVQRAAWMGLYRDSWKWADGGNSSFRNWNRDEPSNNGKEECAAANFGNAGKWEGWSCSKKKAFVCYAAGVSIVCD
uniref:C-type lectin domain-containing protein n=1 Tax=Poecilia latipinna TaxID=48699 RepID=A0A3B3ULL5_9TELE